MEQGNQKRGTKLNVLGGKEVPFFLENETWYLLDGRLHRAAISVSQGPRRNRGSSRLVLAAPFRLGSDS